MIRCAYGDAFAGMLAGPGTSWGRVREAMREADVVELAAGTVEAIEQTLTGEHDRLRRAAARPAAKAIRWSCLTPHDGGIEVEAYHAETAGEYLEQAWALLKRNFREGPHDALGHRAERCASPAPKAIRSGCWSTASRPKRAAEVEFTLAACEVDLLATEPDG